MRAVILLVLMGALPSFAEDDPDRALHNMEQYVGDAQVLCAERISSVSIEPCFSMMIEAAKYFAVAEAGHFSDFSLELDGDDEARSGVQKIAAVCKAMTMDGKRVDSIEALFCLRQKIAERNLELRREKRLRDEG